MADKNLTHHPCKSAPIISVITVSYNAIDNLEETIISIITNLTVEIEFIVVDGGSTDGTLEIIKKYEEKINVFICEKDNGIYDAMNKGIKNSNGKYLCFINAGDKLLSLPVETLKNVNRALVCFPVILSSGRTKIPVIGTLLKITNTLPHQGCFYLNKSELRYSLAYSVFSDFDLNQKIFKSNEKILTYKSPIVCLHDIGGISNDKKYGHEIGKVIYANFGLFYYILSWGYFKFQGAVSRFNKVFKWRS